MIYRFKKLSINGVYEIETPVVSDIRGTVSKDYDKNIFFSHGIEFVPQESLIISSKKNVLRGLHLQIVKEQDRLVRCIAGSVYSVVVDCRGKSETVGKWIKVNINGGNEVYVPKGCAFGTLALEDSKVLCRFGCNFFDSKYATSVQWNDEELGILWPINHDTVLVSEKDKNAMFFHELIEKSVCKI